MGPYGDGCRDTFVVASETAALHDPTEGPFHYPAALASLLTGPHKLLQGM